MKGKWISVEDVLPENLPGNKKKKVIPCLTAATSRGDRKVVQYRQRRKVYEYGRGGWGWEWTKVGSGGITHWMPLPEPPEEAK